MAGAFMLGANLAQSGVAGVRGVPSVSDLQNIQITGTKTAFTTNLGAPADITGRSFSSVAADINAGKITTANRATVPLNLQIPVNPLENLAGLGFTPITTEAYGMETAAGIRTNIMANDQYSISRNMVTGENNFLVNTNPNANYQNVYGNLQNDISNILGIREPGTEANLGKPGQVSFQNANPIPLSVQNAFGITEERGIGGTEVIRVTGMSAFTNAAVEVSGITPKGVLVKVSGRMQAFGEIFRLCKLATCGFHRRRQGNAQSHDAISNTRCKSWAGTESKPDGGI